LVGSQISRFCRKQNICSPGDPLSTPSRDPPFQFFSNELFEGVPPFFFSYRVNYGYGRKLICPHLCLSPHPPLALLFFGSHRHFSPLLTFRKGLPFAHLGPFFMNAHLSPPHKKGSAKILPPEQNPPLLKDLDFNRAKDFSLGCGVWTHPPPFYNHFCR